MSTDQDQMRSRYWLVLRYQGEEVVGLTWYGMNMILWIWKKDGIACVLWQSGDIGQFILLLQAWAQLIDL